MTAVAGLAVTATMHIIVAMAAAAGLIELRFGSLAVTGVTGQALVRAIQHETGILVVIETP